MESGEIMEFSGYIAGSMFINLIILIYIVGMFYSARAYFWKRVDGVITKSELFEYKDDEGMTMYKPEIEYKYSVNNQDYCGNYIAFAVADTNIKSSAEHYLSFYGKDWKVGVYVNPFNPTKAVLAPGIRYHNLAFLVMFIIITYFGVPVGWAMWSYLKAL